MNIIQDGLLEITAYDVKYTNATQQIGNLISVISETITAEMFTRTHYCQSISSVGKKSM